ncbi:protein amalgam-like [Argonauta hians]
MEGVSFKFLLVFTLNFLTFSAVLSVDPQVNIKQPEDKYGDKTITAMKNDDVSIVCVIINKEANVQVKWNLNNGKTQTDVGLDTSSSNPQKYIIVQVSSVEWRLTIQNVQEDDKGEYACKVQIADKQYSSDYRILRVIEKPQILDISTSSDTSVDAGEKINLQCNAQGLPDPKISWSRMAGADLPGGGMMRWNENLPITAILASDRGKYICRAVNIAGVDKRVISVFVRFPPQIRTENKVIRQALGYSTELVCFVEAYPDVRENQISWTRIGTPIDQKSNRYTYEFISGAFNRVTSKLIISDVRPEDYANYVCKATNTKGSSEGQISLEKSSNPVRDRTGMFRSAAPTNSPSLSAMVLLVFYLLQNQLN